MPLVGVAVSGYMDSTGSWKDTFFTVFLMPKDGMVFMGVVDARGSLKVTLFFILMLRRVTASIQEREASLSTLNSRIFKQKDAVYDSRIWGLMESQKILRKWVGYDLGSNLSYFGHKLSWKGWRVPLWEIHVCEVSSRAPFLGYLTKLLHGGKVSGSCSGGQCWPVHWSWSLQSSALFPAFLLTGAWCRRQSGHQMLGQWAGCLTTLSDWMGG